MPIISALTLTNQLPINTYTSLVVTSASFLANGLGNQLYSASITSSYAVTALGIQSGSISLPQTGSIFFSGSFLYVYAGSRWKSASLF